MDECLSLSGGLCRDIPLHVATSQGSLFSPPGLEAGGPPKTTNAEPREPAPQRLVEGSLDDEQPAGRVILTEGRDSADP
jgi:hypothetical protein